MPIELGMALKLLGGAPHLKVASFIAEKLPIAKVLDGGPLGGLLAQVLQDGPQAVVQNPIAAVASELQDALGSAANALGSIPGAAGLVLALTGSGDGLRFDHEGSPRRRGFGEISPGEGNHLQALVFAHIEAIKISDLAARVEDLEAHWRNGSASVGGGDDN